MDDGSILSVLIILALLLFADYFAVCETSFAAVSRIRLKTAMERGDRRANKAMYVCERFDKAITTILIGTNIVHLSCASYVTVLVTRRWGLSAVTLSTFVTTLVVFFVGEMLPKSFAKKYSLRLALGTASSLVFFMHLLTPVSFVLTKIGEFASRLTKGDSEVSVTEDELYDIIENMTDEGDLDSEQGDLVHSALAFGDLTAESILTARVDMETIDVDDPLEEILAQVKASRHSRIPVYQDSVDNIIGVLQIRRFMREYLQKREKTDLRSLLDEPYFVHQSAKIDELLSVMSSKKINMTIVTDSYGGTVGIVTVEDILARSGTRTTRWWSPVWTTGTEAIPSTPAWTLRTPSSSWTTRTPTRRTLTTSSWASGPTSSLTPSPRRATASPITACASLWRRSSSAAS